MAIASSRRLQIAMGLLSAALSVNGCSRERSTSKPNARSPAPDASGSDHEAIVLVDQRFQVDRAIAHCPAIGGSFEREEDDPSKPVVTIFLDGPGVSDQDLDHLRPFNKLQRLSLIDWPQEPPGTRPSRDQGHRFRFTIDQWSPAGSMDNERAEE